MFAPATQDRRYAGKRQTAKSYSIPASTGGINAADGFTEMKPEDAVGLTNVFPETTHLAIRGGYAPTTTGLGGPVRTLLTWNGLTGTDKLFGAAGTHIWDCNTGTASSVVSGLTNVDFQWTTLENAGGLFLVYVNGADAYGAYDGTTWTTPTVTGATAADFINVAQFKERLWFAVKDSLDLYYLPVQAIAGAASVFPLGSVFRRGGKVMGLGSFSNDAGEGPDDYFCIITNNGEIAVYQGTDPDSATTWSLVGIFDVGKPIGRRSMQRLNGDLSVVTQDGVISMQAALQFDRASIQKAAITGKIQTLFGQLAQQYFTNFGWQPFVYPKTRYMIVNVPAVADMSQSQLVMNTVSGAWCQFNNWNAGCWGGANDLLYFGGNDGTVYQAAVGFQDNGSAIQWDVQTSWQMQGGATTKFFTMVRPVMITGGGIEFAIDVDVDFLITTPSGVISSPPTAQSIWPMTWPWTWGGQSILDQRWQSAGALGTWSSIHVAGTSNSAACSLNSFDLVVQTGGIL